MLTIDLSKLQLEQQHTRLIMYNIFPYNLRSFLRLCIFFRKIMNNEILSKLNESLKPVHHSSRHNSDLYSVPSSRTKAGSHIISIFLPECMNIIIRHSCMISLKDFKTFIIFNILNFH